MSPIEKELREYHASVYAALRADMSNYKWRTAKSPTADMALRAAEKFASLSKSE